MNPTQFEHANQMMMKLSLIVFMYKDNGKAGNYFFIDSDSSSEVQLMDVEYGNDTSQSGKGSLISLQQSSCDNDDSYLFSYDKEDDKTLLYFYILYNTSLEIVHEICFMYLNVYL